MRRLIEQKKLQFSHLLGFVLGLRGAPDLILALGYCDRYVIMDCSSMLGLIISSGLIS